MIIVLKPGVPADAAQRILDRIAAAGLQPLHLPGTERVVLGALGDERVLAALALDGDPAVESVKPILSPYKLVSRELHPHDTIVNIGDVPVGGMRFTVIAGPCAVESADQLLDTARAAVRIPRVMPGFGQAEVRTVAMDLSWLPRAFDAVPEAVHFPPWV